MASGKIWRLQFLYLLLIIVKNILSLSSPFILHAPVSTITFFAENKAWLQLSH